MHLTKQEVEHLAKLSRLALSEDEKEKFSSQLSSVLDYVGQLQKVDTKGVISGHITGLENVFRNDETKKLKAQEVDKLIKAAPEQEGSFVKTKAVFEE